MSKMDEISVMYADLQKKISNEMKSIVKKVGTDCEGGKKITLNENQTADLKYYTNYEITEIGNSERVSKGIYIKTTKGVVTAFCVLPTDIQYNIVSRLNKNL